MSLDWRPPILETERLILRPVTQDDAGAVFLYASNPNLTRFTLFETHQTIEDSRWFVSTYAHSRYTCKEPDPFGIVIKYDPDGMMVGALGAHWLSQPNGTMEIGYSIAEPFWGHGYIPEACQALIDYLYANFAVERLQARVFVGNIASDRVLEKLGFMKEGVLRSLVFRRGAWCDIAMWSLLRSDWQSRETLNLAVRRD